MKLSATIQSTSECPARAASSRPGDIHSVDHEGGNLSAGPLLQHRLGSTEASPEDTATGIKKPSSPLEQYHKQAIPGSACKDFSAWCNPSPSVESWLEHTSAPSILNSSPEPETSKKRKRSPSIGLETESSETVLLTADCLAEAQAAMSSPPALPVTPDRSLHSTASRSLSGNDNVDSLNPFETGSKSSCRHEDLEFYMGQHGMYMGKCSLRNHPNLAYRSFYDKAYNIICDERRSEMKSASAQKLWDRSDDALFQNEDTILERLIPCIIKDHRSVPASGPLDEHQDYVVADEEFDKAGLAVNTNREFARTYLPSALGPFKYDENIAKGLEKYYKMKNPKPDRAYGFRMNHFPLPPGKTLHPEHKHLLEISPTLNSCFWGIEGKANVGSMTRAKLQACRTGAVLVHTARLALERTGQNDDEPFDGPDARTMVYTSTMDAGMMQFFVNFAVIAHDPKTGQKSVTYQMEYLTDLTYRAEGNGAKLRRICHNILGWGIVLRYEQIEKRCNKIYDFDTQALLEARRRQQKIQEEKSSKKRKGNTGSGSVELSDGSSFRG